PSVPVPPRHRNWSTAGKNREKPPHPMSAAPKRRLRAILLSLYAGSPAYRHKSGVRRYLSLPSAPGFADRHRDLLEFARPDHLDRLGGADFDLAEPRIQVFQALGRRSVEGGQGVALHQPGFVGGALRLDGHDQ